MSAAMIMVVVSLALMTLISVESFSLLRSVRQSAASRSTLSMAVAPHKRPRVSNIAGNLFVDESCIDCDVCRWMCPSIYDRKGIKSRVFKQPESDIEKIKAYAAMISCPVGSIRLKSPDPLVKEAFAALPNEIDPERLPGVYHLGFHHVDSYGATSYLIHRTDDNNSSNRSNRSNSSNSSNSSKGSIMVDSPRFNSRLADQIEKTIGGNDKLQYMFLTHKDDVSDHRKWKNRFPTMKRIIHAADVNKDTSECEIQLSGDWQWVIDDECSIVHTPGHTAGSLCMFYNPHTRADAGRSDGADRGENEGADVGGYDDIICFSGDHLAYSAKRQSLDGFKRYNKGNVDVQRDSLTLLANLENDPKIPRFNWLLPGHGRMIRFEGNEQQQAALLRTVVEFEEEDEGMGMFGVGYA